MSVLLVCSCNMDITPKNIVSDDDMMGSPKGMSIYMATLYSHMPFEDFKYMAAWGFNFNGWLGTLGIDGSGEAMNRDDVFRTFRGEDNPCWSNAFELIHDANHLIESLPSYRSNFTESEYDFFMGQGYFVRAYVFYQMARRFGGVPLVTHTIAYPNSSDRLEIPRASEEDTWDWICKDFDTAISFLPATSLMSGLPNKYAALAFKAEAMLYAGSVAKYNETVTGRLTGFGDKTGVRVIGFSPDTYRDAYIRYFSEAYKAAREVMESGRYSLYKKKWAAGDSEAMYQNMIDMFSDLSSPENILVKEYLYPSLTHGLDAYSSPFIFRDPLCSGSCPSLDFVELFDGFDRYADGTIRVTDGNDNTKGHYLMFDSTMDFFKNAEPRLRAYVILPGDVFRNQEIEIRAGIYTGSTPVSPLWDDYSWSRATQNFYQNLTQYTGTPKTLYLSPRAQSGQEIVTLDDDTKMTAAGANGPFYDVKDNEANLSGFYLRKYLNPDPNYIRGEGKSAQPFILMRYADVLLAAAEAGVELSIDGVTSPVEGDNMLDVATKAINDIRERAGADLLTGSLAADEDSRNQVRRERRKELAFEHKSKWDIRRWRVQHAEGRDGFWGEKRDASRFGNGESYRLHGLYPFYSTVAKKYFFDANFQMAREMELKYTPTDYYFEIPSGEVAKSPVIDQQPNR